MAEDIPETLRLLPNIPFEKQSLEQLREEHSYWSGRIWQTSNSESVKAAYNRMLECESWINRLQPEGSTRPDERGDIESPRSPEVSP